MMKRSDCRRAIRLLEAVDPLSTDQQQILDVHLACCDECRERQDLWSGLQRAVREEPLPPLDPMLERRLLTGREPAVRPPVRRTGRPWIAAAALATGCGAAAAWLVVQLVAPPSSAPVVVSLPPAHEIAEGTPAGDGLPLTCASPGTALWLQTDAAVVEARNDRSQAHFHLDRGLVVAEVGDNDPGYRFVVETPTILVEALGTIFSVDVQSDGREVVRVAEGVVRVIGATDGEIIGHVGSGEEMVVGDPRPVSVPWSVVEQDLAVLDLPAPQPGDGVAALDPAPIVEALAAPAVEQEEATDEGPLPDLALAEASPGVEDDNLTLLTSLAHAHQRAGEYEIACSVYRRIMDSYPDTLAASNSLVTLGQIELSALDLPAQALDRFDAYLELAPSGALLEEARIGRIRALSQLDRLAEVIISADEFAQRHPRSSALAEVLRLRGDAHLAGGDHTLAARDYEELLARWPTSPQADAATAGLCACTGR
jgi:ferric-dicitrate binding protein FerR (iron transport regulator)